MGDGVRCPIVDRIRLRTTVQPLVSGSSTAHFGGGAYPLVRQILRSQMNDWGFTIPRDPFFVSLIGHPWVTCGTWTARESGATNYSHVAGNRVEVSLHTRIPLELGIHVAKNSWHHSQSQRGFGHRHSRFSRLGSNWAHPFITSGVWGHSICIQEGQKIPVETLHFFHRVMRLQKAEYPL